MYLLLLSRNQRPFSVLDKRTKQKVNVLFTEEIKSYMAMMTSSSITEKAGRQRHQQSAQNRKTHGIKPILINL